MKETPPGHLSGHLSKNPYVVISSAQHYGLWFHPLTVQLGAQELHWINEGRVAPKCEGSLLLVPCIVSWFLFCHCDKKSNFRRRGASLAAIPH